MVQHAGRPSGYAEVLVCTANFHTCCLKISRCACQKNLCKMHGSHSWSLCEFVWKYLVPQNLMLNHHVPSSTGHFEGYPGNYPLLISSNFSKPTWFTQRFPIPTMDTAVAVGSANNTATRIARLAFFTAPRPMALPTRVSAQTERAGKRLKKQP